MEYFSLVLVLAAVILAIRGNTWNKSGMTKWGYMTLLVAMVGLVVSILTTYENDLEKEKNTVLLNSANDNAKDSAIKIELLDKKTDEYQKKIDSLNSQLSVYQNVINDIKVHSNRQEQVVMIQAVKIQPYKFWKAPNKIFSGSKVEAYFFEGNALELRYAGRNQTLIRGTDNWAKLFVIGDSGSDFSWTIYNPTNRVFEGKIEVKSTPRSRSLDWSWLEENISKKLIND